MRGKCRKRRTVRGPGKGGGIWLIVIESEPEFVHGLRSLGIKAKFIATKELLQLDAMSIVGLRVDVPDEGPCRPLRADERIFAADDIDVATP